MKQKLYEVGEFDSINEMLDMARQKASNLPAFMYKQGDDVREVSYAEFCHDVSSLLSAIRSLGIDGSHIACLSENRYEWINVFLGVLCSKGVFVPIDRDVTDTDVINVLDHSDSEVLFCSGRYEGLIRDNADKLKNIKYIISFDRKEDEGNYLSFEKLRSMGEMAVMQDTQREAQLRDPANMAMLIYTSGTTGMPKGVMLSENNIISCIYNGLQLCKLEGRCLSMLPYSHAYEAICGILGSIHSHATVCINESVHTIGTNLKLYKPSYIYTVPAFLEAIYQRIWRNTETKRGKIRLKSFLKLSQAAKKIRIDAGKNLFAALHNTFGTELKKIFCGGAPLRTEVAEFFEAAGFTVLCGYGLTECSPLVSVNPDYASNCHTVGVPLPCLEIDIINPQRDDNGEITIKGPTVMMGYYKNEKETKQVLTPDGFLLTGDRGHMTDDGHLIITGRAKNLIILSNGRIVHPEEVEEYIYKIDYVKEVVVYGIREETGIRELCAEVYMDPDKQTGDIIEQTEILRRDISDILSELAFYKQVSRIVIRPQEFPKTTNNKIKRSELGI